MAKKLNFKITEPIAVLGENMNGWTKELNLVSWNDREPKYDIREWDEDHQSMSKGITMNREEFLMLYEAIKELDEDDI